MKAGVESGPVPCPCRGPGLLRPSQPWHHPCSKQSPPGCSQHSLVHMHLCRGPSPLSLLPGTPPAPQAEGTPLSTHRWAPTLWSWLQTLSLPRIVLRCAPFLCDVLITGEGEACLAQCAPAPPQPEAMCQHHVCEILSPKCLSPPESSAGGPGREGRSGSLCVCRLGLVAGTEGTHPAREARVPQHRGVFKPGYKPHCPDKGWLGTAFSPDTSGSLYPHPASQRGFLLRAVLHSSWLLPAAVALSSSPARAGMPWQKAGSLHQGPRPSTTMPSCYCPAG